MKGIHVNENNLIEIDLCNVSDDFELIGSYYKHKIIE